MRLAIITLLALTLVSVSPGQSKSNPRKAIEQLIARHNRAMEHKDVKELESEIAPGARFESEEGRVVDSKFVMKQIKGMLKSADKIVAHSKIQSFNLKGGYPHLVSVGTLDFQINAQVKGRKRSKVHTEATREEIWKPLGGTYKILSVHTTRTAVSIDGKPVRNPTGAASNGIS